MRSTPSASKTNVARIAVGPWSRPTPKVAIVRFEGQSESSGNSAPISRANAPWVAQVSELTPTTWAFMAFSSR